MKSKLVLLEKICNELSDLYFHIPTTSQLDSQIVWKKIKKIKTLESLPGKDLEIFYADYDLANYFLAHGKYESALAFFNRLNILIDKLSWGFPNRDESLLRNYFKMSAIINANIGHCFFQLKNFKSAYLPYFRCYYLLETYYKESREKIEYIYSKFRSCLGDDAKLMIHDNLIAQCRNEELVCYQRFKSNLKQREDTLKNSKNLINFLNFHTISSIYDQSSYLGKDNDILKNFFSIETNYLDNYLANPTMTSDLLFCLDRIEKIFYNISPFDKQARIFFKNCLFKVKRIYLESTQPEIEPLIEALYTRLQQSYYLDLTESQSDSYLEINLLQPSVIKQNLKSDNMPLTPGLEVIKLTKEDEKQVASTISQVIQFSKLKSSGYIIDQQFHIYFLKMFTHSYLELKEEAESLLKKVTSLQNKSNDQKVIGLENIAAISVLLRLSMANHALFCKNFAESVIHYDELLQFIEQKKIFPLFKRYILINNYPSFLVETKILAQLNRDFAIKAIKATEELAPLSTINKKEESIKFKQRFDSIQKEKEIKNVQNKKKKKKGKTKTSIPTTDDSPKQTIKEKVKEKAADIIILPFQFLEETKNEIKSEVKTKAETDKKEEKHDFTQSQLSQTGIEIKESKESKELALINNTISAFVGPDPTPLLDLDVKHEFHTLIQAEDPYHVSIQNWINTVTQAHDEKLNRAGIIISEFFTGNPVTFYYENPASNKIVSAYAGEYPWLSDQCQASLSHLLLDLNQFPIDMSQYSFIAENLYATQEPQLLGLHSSLISTYIHPIRLLCDNEVVSYICLNKLEIDSIVSLPSSQIKARKIVTLAFNTVLDEKLMIKIFEFLHNKKIEVDKLNLKNTGLTYKEISIFVAITHHYSINSILYLNLCGNPLFTYSDSEDSFLELQVSLQKILENCPFLISLVIEYPYIFENGSAFEKQITKNAENFSDIIRKYILKNDAVQLDIIFQDILILKCLDIFMEEFYEYAANHNSLWCLNVLLNLPVAKNHTQEIDQLATRTTSHDAAVLMRDHLFNTVGRHIPAIQFEQPRLI